MSPWLISLIYVVAVFGLCNMVAYGSGPFRIFERLRSWAEGISDHFGLLFKCMMCLPANVGWILSLVDWFLISSVAFTPFNILLAGTGLWWLAMILDCCFTSGVVWLIHQLDEWLEKEPNITNGDIEKYMKENGYEFADAPSDEDTEVVELAPVMNKKRKKLLLD